MSFLYPLFLAGIAAIGIPILAHMIRSRTRKRMAFSSLMFVPVTLPRFRNRNRIEHLLLLILRCLVFCLLAFAFSRPFFRQSVAAEQTNPGKRIVVLIDTSASIRRADLWAQAVDRVQSVLKGANPMDRLCIMSFDLDTRTLIGFEQWQALEPAQRVAVTSEQMSKLSPGWATTDIGRALVAASEAIEDDEVNDDQQQALAIRQVVLISDLQQGSSLEALQAYQWPRQTELIVRAVRCQGATNAAMQLIDNAGGMGDSDDDDRPRIRITNSSDATAERFQLHWADEPSSDTSGEALDMYVAPGRSIVTRVPPRTDKSTAHQLVLTGDDHDFDNTLFLSPALERQMDIHYIGDDEPNDPEEMLYFVRKAFSGIGALRIRVISHKHRESIAGKDIDASNLIVVVGAMREATIAASRKYLESGGTVLMVVNSADATRTMGRLAGIDNLESQQADVDRYAMLGRVEFRHPIMSPFSEPRFGDFTRIHFWKYQRIDIAACPDAHVLTLYDNNDPAWFEIPVGQGTLLVFTAGWSPSDSDLALSSKFVPLLYSILEYGGSSIEQQSQYFVGDSVPIPSRLTRTSSKLTIRKPDDSVVALDAGQQVFEQTDMPGVYTLESLERSFDGDTASASGTGREARQFAVNLSDRESKTAPMQTDSLEVMGVSFSPSPGSGIEQPERTRYHSSYVDMENKQKIWRWVLALVLAVLLVEIWLAGWLTRPAPVLQGEQR